MLIDIRTMLVVLAASSLLMALTLWLAFPRPLNDGLGKWAAGLVLQGVAWMLFAARGLGSDMLTVVAGNLVFSLGVALKVVSILEFQKRRVPLWLPYVLPAGIALCFLLLLDSIRAQSFFNGIAYSIVYAGIVWLMLRPPHTTSQRVRWMMVLTFSAASLGFLVRGILAATFPEVIPHPLAPGPLQTVSHLFGYIVLLSSSAGILLMHKERADEHTRQQAATDPLTGVYNRRIFIEIADMAVARAQRNRLPLSLLMLDLDHFKAVNDAHGHMVGDEVLKSFVRVVQTCLRREDMMVRFGGEEFCVLLPDA